MPSLTLRDNRIGAAGTTGQRFKLETKIPANLSLSDEEFVYNVNCDLAQFLEKRRSNCILLFPPVNNYRRFLIHRSCENYREFDIFTFSVGQGPYRRTVICFKSQLLDPIKFTAASSLETRKTAQVKSWRSGGEKIESATTSSLWSSPSSSSSLTLSTKTTKRDIAAATTTANSSSMGVEKHLDTSSSASARLNKSHSVDIYRPPALRRNLESIDNDNQLQPQQQQQQQQQDHLQEQQELLSLQSNDTNCILAKPLPPVEFNPSETTQSCCNGIDTATTTATSSTSCSNQRQIRRERRPDRAVYVPRARRSQTTPPAVSTQPQPHLQSPHQQAIPVTEINNQLTSLTATSSLSSGTINTTTTITTTLTGTCKSPSGDKSSGSNSRRSHKDRASGNGVRKEKSSLKRLSVDENEKINPNKSNISINNHNSEEETAVHNIREPRKQLHQHRVDKQPPMPVGSVNLNGLSNCNDKNALLVKDCDITNPKEFPDSTNLTNSKKSVNIAASDMKKVLPKMTTTSPPTPVPEPFVPPVISENVGNLRIEDALMTGGERSEKCDRDAEELLRASKEINRSNRRIIKQTFNSDVLEIPEKAVFNSNSVVKKTAKDDCKNVSTLTSGTDEDEGDEDDWDSMYDESGDCLDPKILQELTASVGKVKIELPKMDYSAYLTKQSLLNDEEFPHVLEVSNFPVEFKNQDLLMVFSQYKESGFDIKWVDDTHALAVFSSSQVAAEVLAMGHPFVVLKPLAEATVESRLKAKKCSSSLQPYRPRPETCAALARRLVTGALGVRLKTAAQEREIEKRVLREAKERKLLAAKQRDEAWES